MGNEGWFGMGAACVVSFPSSTSGWPGVKEILILLAYIQVLILFSWPEPSVVVIREAPMKLDLLSRFEPFFVRATELQFFLVQTPFFSLFSCLTCFD